MIRTIITEESGYKVDHAKIKEVVEKTLTEHGKSGEIEVGVIIVGEAEMKKLHKAYMETEEVTDVLSFPLDDKPGPDGVIHLGDIVICWPVAKTQAEAEFLAEHGCLHLLGIHHKE
jgi:probable rRNA maturation factor